jgi:putative transcriptional regulator
MSRDITSMDSLTGQLLIAMPNMGDPRFARTVIYLCAHSTDGAMGLVVNRLLEGLSFAELLEQLSIPRPRVRGGVRLHTGGPVEGSRGFVLHTTDYVQPSSLVVDGDLALTATVDILRAIAERRGPRQALLALGYAGWGPGQLEAEIQANGWLNAPADEALVFGAEVDTAWERSLGKLGVTPSLLSGSAGHA